MYFHWASQTLLKNSRYTQPYGTCLCYKVCVQVQGAANCTVHAAGYPSQWTGWLGWDGVDNGLCIKAARRTTTEGRGGVECGCHWMIDMDTVRTTSWWASRRMGFRLGSCPAQWYTRVSSATTVCNNHGHAGGKRTSEVGVCCGWPAPLVTSKLDQDRHSRLSRGQRKVHMHTHAHAHTRARTTTPTRTHTHTHKGTHTHTRT